MLKILNYLGEIFNGATGEESASGEEGPKYQHQTKYLVDYQFF